MKLEQSISGKCKVTSTLRSVDAVDQSIVLILPDTAKDVEKASVVAKVTNELVRSGWVVVNTQTLDHVVTVEYTKPCGLTAVIASMLSCQ